MFTPRRSLIVTTSFLCCLFFTSCTALLNTTVINPAVGNLQKQSDIDLVCEGSSAYLLMIDSLIAGNPENKALLLNGTKAYSGATAAFVSCSVPPERINAISLKAKHYGKRLLQFYLPVDEGTPEEVIQALNKLKPDDADTVFWGTFGWLTWIQQQQGSPKSMADLIIVEKLMQRLLLLDESVENGAPHLFFGALYGTKPAMAGGDTVKSRFHFERALVLSNRSNLLVQTTFAETYCRMTFNQELHDALLQEVLAFPVDHAPGATLINQIAKRKAQQLLDDNFFE